MIPIKIKTNEVDNPHENEEGVWVNYSSSHTHGVGSKAMVHKYRCFMPMADLHVFTVISAKGSYSHTAVCQIGEERAITVKKVKADNGKTRVIRSLSEAYEIAESLYWDALKEAQATSY